MKKILALFVVTSCAGILFAQDVIALINGDRIEDVTIQSVTNEEIIYILNGKTETIPHNSAQAILYADGRYEEIKLNVISVPSSATSDGTQIVMDLPTEEDGAALGRDLVVYFAGHSKQAKAYNAAVKQAQKLEIAGDCYLIAISAYMQKKRNGASGNEACGAFISTYIETVNQRASAMQ